MVGGGVHAIPEGFEPSPYIVRAYRNSECRVPVVVALEDGDPFTSIAKLAKDGGCAVWTIAMGDPKSEQNALDYIEVGLQNGDWVYLTDVEESSSDTLRKIALTLSTLAPDPKHFPRRECFRLWLVVSKHIDLNERINPVLPQLLAQNTIVAHRGGRPKTANKESKNAITAAPVVADEEGKEGSSAADAGVVAVAADEPPSPEKWVKRMPQEPHLFDTEIIKHQDRRDHGRESDSESDCEEPGQKVVGKWFHRAVDFHAADAGSTVTKASEEVFTLVEADNFDSLLALCRSGHVNLTRLRHPSTNMTALQHAVSLERTKAVRALLEAGADPNIPRDADGCPPLFMAIESQELVQLLIDHGAAYEARFQGYALEKHPDTAPHIAKMIKELKGY